MTTFLIKIAVVFLGILLLFKFIPTIPLSSVVTQKQNLFTVSGEGKVTVAPDTAVLDVGMTVSKPSVKAAQTEANTAINNISTEIKKLGVEDRDIKTSNYSIYPQYDYSPGSNATKINSYQVNVSLALKVRDLEKVNAVIDAATAKGANTIGGIQLIVNEEKQKSLRQEARDKAVAEAREKAESLAKAAGLTLVRVVDIQEASSANIMPMLGMKEAAIGMSGGADTQIQRGSTDIVSSVTLSYETH